MSLETQREVERKLRVHALFRLPPLSGVTWGAASVDPQPMFTMRNIYFDTADLRLFRWGVTLRRREGGPDEGWHMKLPVEGADGGTRDELRVPLTDAMTVPVELSSVVTALVREGDLVPVVTLRTERTPIRLMDAHGRMTAELVDDTVAVLDGDRTAAIFREIEVEGVADEEGNIDLSVLDDVVAALVEHGAVPGTLSKAAAALGPRTSAPPDVAEPRWPETTAPAGDAVRAHIATHVRRFLLNDVRVRRGLPDSVHQLRVSARRLRSGLQVFGPLLDKPWADDLRQELAWAASNLGDARDAEVLHERLDDHAALLDETDAMRARAVLDPYLHQRLAVAEQDARIQMSTPRYQNLLRSLVAAVQDPPLTEEARKPCSDVLPPRMRHAWKRLAKDVRSLSVDGPSAEWHETRIAAKRARYAADALAPIFGAKVQRLAQDLAVVTDVLGTHQDAHVAQIALREMAATTDGEAGFALGLLHEIEGDAEIADRIEFSSRVWRSARKAARASGMC